MPRNVALVAILACILSTNLLGQSDNKSSSLQLKSVPSWIWLTDASANTIAVRYEFELKGAVKQALLAATADNQCDVFINDKKVVSSEDWAQLATSDVGKRLKPGKNVIGLTARNDGGPAGVLAMLVVTLEDGTTVEIGTDDTWRGTATAQGKWKTSGFDDKSWSNAQVIGKVGDSKLPWTGSVDRDALVNAFGSGSGGEFIPEIAANAKVPDGFKIERIFHVPRAMGSWVALTTDPKGRLIASDQGGAGLFMITPGSGSNPTTVEKLPVDLSGAQGLLWAFDSLYAVVNGGDKSGLHRLRDTNGDGLVDSDEHCMFVPGGGEHGPHAVVLSPDGKSLFVAAGNHTKLPEKIAGSRIPQNWNEDHLLPRRWDANGHAAGILAPGGWICNVDESGKNWTVFSMGYRNEYDIAFNNEGELFTYDADMEWDFGSPWYRPTRVCHATSGSEFGWRSGTGKWPAYYEDSLPAAVDIGPGSPTGIVFGTGAKFPEKFQRALFILDWTYSTIYSIEMTPEGASYRGTKADFVTGSPLPVTDAVVGTDGALYFAAGGRGTQSDLYRVSYVGADSTTPTTKVETRGADLRSLRHQLEAFHGNSTGDLKLIMENMGHEDRFIRYAARVALENQPISKWRDAAFAVKGTKAILNSMLAMAHQGTKEDLERIIEKISTIPVESLPENEQLFELRTLQVAFARHGEPSDAWREKLASRLDALYPAKSYPVNAELVQLLVYLKSPNVVAKTLDLMDSLGPEPIPDWGYLISRNEGYGGTVGKMLSNMPPSRAIHFAFMLRNVKSGWTLAQHRKYFEFFIEAAKKPGGNSYAKFLMQFRDDALASCSPAELIVLEPIVGKSLIAAPFESKPAKGPGRKWTTVDALSTVNNSEFKPDFETGRNLYHASSCAKCHRIGGEGGSIGPDLSTAGKKFSSTDMLDAIIEPSKAISDQYGSQQVLTTDGKTLVGRAVEIGDELYVYTADVEAKPVVLKKEDVEQVSPSKVSQMPTGLIDALNDDELRHLMAYIMAAGDNRARVYK
jgi:putative heme-binding domain-containing protein